jgi:hypothetical protein
MSISYTPRTQNALYSLYYINKIKRLDKLSNICYNILYILYRYIDLCY